MKRGATEGAGPDRRASGGDRGKEVQAPRLGWGAVRRGDGERGEVVRTQPPLGESLSLPDRPESKYTSETGSHPFLMGPHRLLLLGWVLLAAGPLVAGCWVGRCWSAGPGRRSPVAGRRSPAAVSRWPPVGLGAVGGHRPPAGVAVCVTHFRRWAVGRPPAPVAGPDTVSTPAGGVCCRQGVQARGTRTEDSERSLFAICSRSFVPCSLFFVPCPCSIPPGFEASAPAFA